MIGGKYYIFTFGQNTTEETKPQSPLALCGGDI